MGRGIDNQHGQPRDLPVLAHGVSTHAWVLRPRGARQRLAIAPPPVLPSAFTTTSAPRDHGFRGSIAPPTRPLPTLHRRPHERQRMTRGHRGSLLLRCRTPSFLTPSRFIRAYCEHMFVRLGQPHDRSPGGHRAARVPRAGDRAPFRRPRGARHPLLRGPRQVRAQPRPRALADAVPLDDQPLQGMQPCVLILLRPPDPHLPRLQRGPRLREGDRRQGQRARGAARRAGAAVVEGRAHRDGDEHRPVPVGRGPLQAHARDLGGAARCGQPVLGADEVAAAAARPRPHEGDRRGHGHQREPLGARRSTRRRGGRASRTRPTRGRGWRPSASSTGRASRRASWSRR